MRKTKKKYISAEEFYISSIKLGKMVYDSGFKPDFLIALWRGGSFPGCIVQEYLKFHNIKTDHVAIRTCGRKTDNSIKKKIEVHAVDYALSKLNENKKLLIIDDIFDSGLTLQEVLKVLKRKLKKRGKNMPKETKIAVVYYKPKKNQTEIEPDFYVKETDDWIILPHEFAGLSCREIVSNKGKKLRKFFNKEL